MHVSYSRGWENYDNVVSHEYDKSEGLLIILETGEHLRFPPYTLAYYRYTPEPEGKMITKRKTVL